MKFAYADPPYFGYGGFYKDHPEWAECDTIEWHQALIFKLETEYSDGWALSCTTGNLFDLLPLFSKRPRIAAWVKPFASFKPGVNPAYTWEPVIFSGGRKRDKTHRTVKDHLACNITLKKGLTGAKPVGVCEWILELLGFQEGDTIDDLFPGTGVMTKVAGGNMGGFYSTETSDLFMGANLENTLEKDVKIMIEASLAGDFTREDL